MLYHFYHFSVSIIYCNIYLSNEHLLVLGFTVNTGTKLINYINSVTRTTKLERSQGYNISA